MDVAAWVRSRGGIASRAELRAAGYPTSAVARAGLERIGRFHLAAATAPLAIKRAVAERGVLACVSAASQRGLQILRDPREIHVAIPVHSNARAAPDVRHHRTRSHLPAIGFVESTPDMLEHVARCLPAREARVIWESALHMRLLTTNEMARIPWRSTAARTLAASVSTLSESVLETLLLHALYEAGIPVRQQTPLLGHRVDALIGRSLVIQADGYENHASEDRDRDLRHDARLILAGYTVLRFSYDDIVRRMPDVIGTIRRAMAQGLHERSVNA